MKDNVDTVEELAPQFNGSSSGQSDQFLVLIITMPPFWVKFMKLVVLKGFSLLRISR